MPINNGNISNNGSGGGGGDNQFIYRGTYNAATNTPTLTNGVGTQGDWYLVTVEGSNNPTGEPLKVNQVIAYNGAIWQAGGQIDNTDEIQVSNNYIVIRGQTIQVGQSLTVALGELEGQIVDLATSIATALNTKQDLVTGATLNNVATLTASGQTKDSGIASADVTTQGNTFNQANKLIQADSNNALPIMSGSALTGLTKAQIGLSNVQNVDQTNADNITSGTLNNLRLNANVTKLGNDVNGNSQLMFTTSDGYIPSLYAGNTQVVNPTTVSPTTLNQALENVYMSIPAAQIQSNWTESDTASKAYILNKPTLFNNPMTDVGSMILGGTPSGGVAPPLELLKGTSRKLLTIDPTTGLPAWIQPYQYSKIRYVDPVAGSNTTGDGSYGNPWLTVLYAVTTVTTGMIVCLMGQSTEAAFSIPANKTNIDIIALGTRSALNGFNNKVTVLGTGAGSVRFQDLNFAGGLTRDATSTCGIYLYNGSIGATGFSQLGNGYTEFVGTDASNGVNTISAGSMLVAGGKFAAFTLSGANTRLAISGDCGVVGNATVGAGSILAWLGGYHYVQATGFAVTAPANSTVLIDGVQFVRPDGTLATLSLSGFWSIQYSEFMRTGSTLAGTNLGALDWFDKIGLLNARTITTATKMLVIDPATGELCEQLIPSSGGARSALYLAGWGAGTPVANGNINFNDATTTNKINNSISYAGGTDITLEAGKNYKFTVMINSTQAGTPSASSQTYAITGTDFNTSTVTIVNGAISNNQFLVTAPGGLGSAVFATAYNVGGVMNLFTPRAILYPTQLSLSSFSTTSNAYAYTQVTNGWGNSVLVKNGAISAQTLTRTTTVGGASGANEAAFNHPFNGTTPLEYAACAGFNVSVVSNALTANRFAFSIDNGSTYVTQSSPLANDVILNGSLTACYGQDINRAVFIGTTGVSCKVDLTGEFTQFNVVQGIKQVVRGNLSGTQNFIAVGNNTTWNQFTRSTNGDTWLAMAANNLTSVLPSTGTLTPVYAMGGVCQTLDNLGAWLVAVNDTANNITYVCSSADLVTFSALVNYNGFNVNGLFTAKVSGVGLSAGASTVMMYSSNTTGAANRLVYNTGFWATAGDWKISNNIGNFSTGIRGSMSPSGVFTLWRSSGGNFDFMASADGGNSFSSKTVTTSFTYLMPLGDYKFCSCSDVSASRQYSASYRNTYTATAIYDAMWAGGQQLTAGVSSSTTVTPTDRTIASYAMYDDGSMLVTGANVATSASSQYYKVGMTNVNSTEKISSLGGSAYVISNTFLFSATGVNCTVSGTTQAPGLQGNIQDAIQGVISSVNASAVLRFNCNYNNGTNTLGGGNSVLIEEI